PTQAQAQNLSSLLAERDQMYPDLVLRPYATVYAARTLGVGPPYGLHGFYSQVRAVAFAPDGQRLAAAERNGTIRIWNVYSGDLLSEHTFPASLPVYLPGYRIVSMAFTPDGGEVFVALENGELHFLDTSGGGARRVVRTPIATATGGASATHLRAASLSPDGQQLSLLRDASPTVWITALQEPAAARELAGHTRPVTT